MAEKSKKKGLRSLFKKSKEAGEIEEFCALIEKDPENDRSYIRLAEVYARSGMGDKAIETYRQAAELFEKRGFVNKARAVVRQALSIDPEDGGMNFLLAEINRKSGLEKDSILRYQMAANYYVKHDQKERAIEIFKIIIKLNPGDISFTIKLATLLVAEKQYSEADEILSPIPIKLKATGKTDQYITVLRLLQTTSGGDLSITNSLIDAYISNGNYNSALSILHKEIMKNPDSIPLLQKLIYVFEKKEDTEKTISSLKQLASAYNARRDLAKRDDCYRKVYALDPNDREALLALEKNDRLRDLISDKIEESSSVSTELSEDGDIVIDFEESVEPASNIIDTGTVIKEAQVFVKFNLYHKAVDRLTATPGWEEFPELIEMLIEVSLMDNNKEQAAYYAFQLIDLYITRKEISKAVDLFNDATSFIQGTPKFNKTKDLLGLNKAEPKVKSEKIVKNESLENNIDNLFVTETIKEPDKKQLEEMEFYLNMDDLDSAAKLLQELFLDFPDSEVLKAFKEMLPEDIINGSFVNNLSDTTSDLNEIMDDGLSSAEDYYNMGMSQISMSMYDNAEHYFEKAIEKDKKIKYLSAMAECSEHTGNADKLILSLVSSLDEISSRKDQEIILVRVAEVCDKTGNHSEADFIKSKLNELKDL